MKHNPELDSEMRRGVAEMEHQRELRRQHQADVAADRTRPRRQILKTVKRAAQTATAVGLGAAAVYVGGRPGPDQASAAKPTGGETPAPLVKPRAERPNVDSAPDAATASTGGISDQPMTEGTTYSPETSQVSQPGGAAAPETHPGGVPASETPDNTGGLSAD